MTICVCSHCGAESVEESDEDTVCPVCNKGIFQRHELSRSELAEIQRDMETDRAYDEEKGK